MKTENMNSIPEEPHLRAARLEGNLRGVLREELAEYGGAEAFLKWVRGDSSQFDLQEHTLDSL
jgi:hypothetical protein